MLIVFAGLPGTGKTTLARELARRLQATYLRIDTLEQAILRLHVAFDPELAPVGYFAAYAVAADNLRLGSIVVADAVNSLAVVRDSWTEVAAEAGVPIVEIEVICSDAVEHRRRVESRQADIPGHTLPTWQEVQDHRVDRWEREHLLIDTAAISVQHAV